MKIVALLITSVVLIGCNTLNLRSDRYVSYYNNCMESGNKKSFCEMKALEFHYATRGQAHVQLELGQEILQQNQPYILKPNAYTNTNCHQVGNHVNCTSY